MGISPVQVTAQRPTTTVLGTEVVPARQLVVHKADDTLALDQSPGRHSSTDDPGFVLVDGNGLVRRYSRAHGPFRLSSCSQFLMLSISSPFPLRPVSSVLHMVHELLILFSVEHPLLS